MSSTTGEGGTATIRWKKIAFSDCAGTVLISIVPHSPVYHSPFRISLTRRPGEWVMQGALVARLYGCSGISVLCSEVGGINAPCQSCLLALRFLVCRLAPISCARPIALSVYGSRYRRLRPKKGTTFNECAVGKNKKNCAQGGNFVPL
jgi:hypothetical protein